VATTIRAQCSWQVGSMLPRDRFTINPYFSHTQVDLSSIDFQQLADDLATALKTWEKAPTNHELTVKMYAMNDPQPRRPRGIAVRQLGAAQPANYMQEIALCLSFTGTRNLPRERGRLFLPHVKISNTQAAVRPAQADRDQAAALVPILANLGGVNVDWSIYSPTDHKTTTVKNWWVDDEWDIQRRRGGRATTRSTGTTSG
jgi:hypothetical protein